ncbi:hypothetical protein Droror1_Dr00016391 [Drosera rotundifolia]
MVINTVLSVMAYDYPPEKLAVYLSDDGCSDLTFYAMLEASQFSKYWLLFCRKYNVEPRSPYAYFSSMPKPNDADHATAFKSVKCCKFQQYSMISDHLVNEENRLGEYSEQTCSKIKRSSKTGPQL